MATGLILAQPRSGVIPRHSLISDDCSKWQPLLFFFLYCFNCVPPLAKPGMCKPGLRSERERITPPADWSTVGNALGGTTESIPVQVQHTSEHQGRMQHFCLSSQQLIVIKEKKKNAEFLPEVPMTTTGLLIVFILRISIATIFLESGKDHGLFAKNIDIVL